MSSVGFSYAQLNSQQQSLKKKMKMKDVTQRMQDGPNMEKPKTKSPKSKVHPSSGETNNALMFVTGFMSMERARDIIKKFEGQLKRLEIGSTSSNGDIEEIKKAIISGCTQTRLICLQAEPEWLIVEIAPHYYKRKKLKYFRAPSPSPVGPGRRSTVANDDILTDFLHQTRIVPDLVLPNRVFSRQNPKIQSLSKLDFKKLNFSDDFKLEEDVRECGKGVFALEDEKKRVVLRTNEQLYGFVDVCGDDKDVTE
uniref:1-aminocyclopropane-1-carboxylate oxidase 5-like n=1 Tax=Tanacetum cinerariifolium TaxID=118510 RepID=A0A6L2JK53_TANCI|nr:1-aminocyclopropane-1-carboxylate oxidase 5-like [Tanacetum cinerariifolium]